MQPLKTKDIRRHYFDLIVAMPEAIALGITKAVCYRQYITQIKDPKFPCVTMMLRDRDLDKSLNVRCLDMFLTLHTKKTDEECSDLGDAIQSALHNYKHSNAFFNIYDTTSTGSGSTPVWDKDFNCWQQVLKFEVVAR